jgi:hypothetical protein
MKPFEPAGGLVDGQWALAEPGRQYLVYAGTQATVRLDLSDASGMFAARWIDLRTGEAEGVAPIRGGSIINIKAPGTSTRVLWLSHQ